MRPAKTQISLGIRPVWSESSLCAQQVVKGQMFLHAVSEDSDQTGRMPRLIWVFAGRTGHFVGFVVRRLKYLMLSSFRFGIKVRMCNRFYRFLSFALFFLSTLAGAYNDWDLRKDLNETIYSSNSSFIKVNICNTFYRNQWNSGKHYTHFQTYKCIWGLWFFES